jgi:uncharacterized lipoprotein YajG
MITMFLMALVGTALILGMLPLLAFSLMLDTCAKRQTALQAEAPMSRSAAKPVEAVVCGQHGVALLAG